MEVILRIEDGAASAPGADPAASAMSLYRWLVAEPELRGLAEVSTGSGQPGQGRMGGALDVIDVVLANGIALGSLITAVAAWRNARPRPPVVRLERDGMVVTLRDGSPEAVERILRSLNETTGTTRAVSDGDGEQP